VWWEQFHGFVPMSPCVPAKEMKPLCLQFLLADEDEEVIALRHSFSLRYHNWHYHCIYD
jgi:hypothetical protein